MSSNHENPRLHAPPDRARSARALAPLFRGICLAVLCVVPAAPGFPASLPEVRLPNIAPTPRPVLVTTFGSVNCGPCYAISKALVRLQAEYPRDEVSVVTFHVYDSFGLPYAESEYESYNTPGLPYTLTNQFQAYVSGRGESEGEAGIQAMYDVLKVMIENEKATAYYQVTPQFHQVLTGDVGPLNPRLEFTLTSDAPYPDPVWVVFLITEDEVPVQALNGLTSLDALARITLDIPLVDLSTPRTVTLTAGYTGTIPYADATKLHPLVYIFNSATDEVLSIKAVFDHNGVSNWSEYE